MNYNRWMPQEYQSGGELYHYGVKGMKWKNKKGVQIEAQEATISGGRLPEQGTVYDPSQHVQDPNATAKAYEKYLESKKPAWQKKWDKSSAKKTLSKIMSKIKSKKPKKKKSKLKVTFSDGTSKNL